MTNVLAEPLYLLFVMRERDGLQGVPPIQVFSEGSDHKRTLLDTEFWVYNGAIHVLFIPV